MALDPIELVLIGVIVVVVLLWGPQKIPELAKSLGRARREFDMASKEFTTTASSLTQTVTAPAAPQKSSDETLLDLARQLGISTDGKTREQISQEIMFKSTGK